MKAKATRKSKQQWDTYEEYLQSDQWKKLREATHERVIEEFHELTCECCLAEPGDDTRFEVHHWTYLPWDNDNSDLHVLLCSTCHKAAHEDMPPAKQPTHECRRDWLFEFVRNNYAAGLACNASYNRMRAEKAEKREGQWGSLAWECIQKLTGSQCAPAALSRLVDKWENG